MKQKLLKIIPGRRPPHRVSYPAAGKERTLSSALKRVSASLSLEAAVVLPLFLGLIAAVVYFLALLSLQSDIQLRVDEAARDISKRAYAAEGSDLLTALNVNPLTVKAQILSGSLGSRLESSQVEGGAAGLHTLLSDFDEESGILDVSVTYKYSFPFLSQVVSAPYFCQHTRCRAWIGRQIKQGSSGSDGEGNRKEQEEETVYITPNGRAYHSSGACPYLDLSVRAAPFATVDFMRNLDGSIYYRCTACAAGGDPHTVYVTDYGTNWHASLDCSGLKRTVTAVKISEVGGRHPCPKCYGEH